MWSSASASSTPITAPAWSAPCTAFPPSATAAAISSGLTCRVGRAVYGTTDIIKDLIESGKSLLILGRPGVGKTTMLREAARILAETKRVVIVDTSNEIGGDGDVPHPAVGRARRMQVATPSLQHEVMIEAVENHNPEAIVIDEIGRELEAAAARTIAERGVQLIGTAHGNTLENLLLNPTLSDLVGGIESVTLSDEEARRRGTQKTVLERRSPPTFDVLIEIQTRDRLAVHPDVAAAVDALAARLPAARPRCAPASVSDIRIEQAPAPARPQGSGQQGYRRQSDDGHGRGSAPDYDNSRLRTASDASVRRFDGYVDRRQPARPGRDRVQSMRIYPYGVARNRLEPGCPALGRPGRHRRRAGEADVWSRCAPTTASASGPSRRPNSATSRSMCCAPTRSTRCSSSWATCSTCTPTSCSNAGMDSVVEETRAAIIDRDERRALGGAAPGGFVYSPHAAPDGA